jgi:hypothetical protein
MEYRNQDVSMAVPLAESENRLILIAGRDIQSKRSINGADDKVLKKQR